MKSSTRYEIAVHLLHHNVTRKLKRAIKSNGLVHPDRKTAMIAARNIMMTKTGLQEIEWINIIRVRFESVAQLGR